ncbi:MAG: hypothetical protein E7299_00045 [Lachnospiraceae bacterium]|nr:hypothetical protein [Lachnospiraceae bacterium]
MKDIIGNVKNFIYSNRKMLWYMICFAFLGLIDQRKQSAPGEIQMLFGNCTMLVLAALVFPSIELHKMRQKVYKIWTPICLMLIVLACIWGKTHVVYMQAWIPAILSMAVWSYLFLYLIQEWKTTEGTDRIRQPFFWCILLLLLCMILSLNHDDVPYWYLMMYGGLYLIGIKNENRRAFFDGLLNGIILWFFVQQIIAFGFRPYDYFRYHGMYAWETFNGLFYLLAYCAISSKWFLSAEREARWYVRFFWFFLSVGCVSFVLLTGGRAALVGVLLSTVVLYGWYDLKKKTSFYRLVLHAIAWLLGVTISFPIVYGCVRYLPTILHHPIWFEGEYVEGQSVCSFDAWDSEKYISFEDAFGMSIGRALDMLEIKWDATKLFSMETPVVLQAYAEEEMDTDVKEKILNSMEQTNYANSISIRKLIYVSCLAQLNWHGHSSGEIPAADGNIYDHAHNMFLDMAYRHGILAGALYLGICAYSVLQALWRRKPENVVIVTFMVGLLCFGMFEQLTMMGQFGVALIWIFFYFVGEDSKILFGKSSKQ